MIRTSATQQQQGRPVFFVVPATTLIGALSGTVVGSAAVIAIGALGGLAWGLIVGRTTYWLGRREGSGQKLAARSLYLGVLVATTLFGGSLFAMMLYASALSTPETVLGLMRAPFGGGFAFFVVFNSLMEWFLLPAILYLNWHLRTRRTLIVASATLYYLSRAWTYLYFVPRIFEFMEAPAGGMLTPDLVSQIIQWVNLSWIRTAVDGVVAILFLIATSRSDGQDNA